MTNDKASIYTQLVKFVPSDGEIPKILTSAAMMTKNAKLRTVLSGGAIAYTIGSSLYHRWREMKEDEQYVIMVTDEDPLYEVLKELIVNTQPESDQYAIEIATAVRRTETSFEDVLLGLTDDDDEEDETPVDTEAFNNLIIMHSGAAPVEITLAGHPVVIGTSSPTIGADGEERGGSDRVTIYNAPKSLYIRCESSSDRRDVISHLNTLVGGMNARAPRYMQATRYGSFRYQRDTPVRPRNSVVLKEGQMDRIFGVIQEFLGSEAEYTRLGVPYRTGLLLHGKPGTGKTSVASVLAHDLKLDVYYVPLSTIDDDGALMELFQGINPRSILLLEDIDAARAATNRKGESKGVTMAGLLNALDGMATPHGLITIMTTNHIESLDAALIRPGRIDAQELINEIDDYQLRMLCLEFLGEIPEDLPEISVEDGIVAADIMRIFKDHMRDLSKAAPDVVAFIEQKVKDTDYARV